MKITRRHLRRIIREERRRLNEVGPPPDIDAPGWHPNMSQEWERESRAESRQEFEAEKSAFLANEQARWEDEFEVDEDDTAALIKDSLSKAYDEIYEEVISPMYWK